MFSSRVLSHWLPELPGPPELLGDPRETGAVVSVDPALPENRTLSLLRLEEGSVVLTLSPERAADLSVADGKQIDPTDLAARIAGSGITLNDPDHLFYLGLEDQSALADEVPAAQTRRLTAADAALFEEFTGAAPEDDLDEAFVELDHWLVMGTLVDGKLASAASMYPWGETDLADLGVITLPAFRGRGLGRATVRAISAEAIRRGFEPQYRCQVENTASIALAEAAGFSRFGRWEVALPPE